jgi:hypothetical protein
MSPPKKQHYVPQFYLREFLDPNTPKGQEPYVWVFAKDGKKKQRRAPKNILWETDLYTFEVEGAKHYELEQALSKIEGEFAEIVRKKIKAHLPLTVQEHQMLCMFVATMLQRTVRQKDNLEGFYDQLVEHVERIETHHGSDGSTSAKLRVAKKNLHKVGILEILSQIPELLGRMSLAFLCTDGTSARFITSDDPVTFQSRLTVAALLRTRTCSDRRRTDYARFPGNRDLHDLVESAGLCSNTTLAYRRAQSVHSRPLL